MKLGLCAALIQWRKKTKLKSNQVDLACVQTSPISFVARGKGTRATKEIGDVCTQARSTRSASSSMQSERGKAKTVLVENNLSKASFPFRFHVHSTKFANGAKLSCDLPEVTLVSGRFVIFKMKFTKIQL